MNEPPDRLEELLRLAAKEPANRPRFYRALLEGTVFVLGNVGSDGKGEEGRDQGTTVSLQEWQRPDGKAAIPFFTSEAALRRAVSGEVSPLPLPTRSLFEMTRGASLVLNPRSSTGKEFLPSEIDTLLRTGLPEELERRVVETSTRVLLGQPKEYPAALVDSLKNLFAGHPRVKAAYLALLHDQGEDTGPHLVVGIEADGDHERIIREAGTVARDVVRRGEPVDLVAIERREKGISQYLVESTKPFYKRSFGALLRSFFPGA